MTGDRVVAGALLILVGPVLCLVSLACDRGTGDLIEHEEPEPPPDTIRGRVIDLSSGNHHVCAATPSGELFCWGSGRFGQIGDGLVRGRPAPARVVPKAAFELVSAGGASTCALDVEGKAWCWGLNLLGELGHDHADTSIGGGPAFPVASRPFPVATSLRFVEIETAGEIPRTCALAPDGAAWCWGRGSHGEMGNGTTISSLHPTPVSGNHRFVDVSVGEDHACGATEVGEVWCWGSNGDGQLGVGDDGLSECGWPTVSACALEPIRVPLDVPLASVSAGAGYTCGQTAGGLAWCWGRAELGQTGAGQDTARTPPAPVVEARRFATVSAGFNHACGLTDNGVAWCWGNGNRGILGVDPGGLTSCGPFLASSCSARPVSVAGPVRFERVFAAGGPPAGRAWTGESTAGEPTVSGSWVSASWAVGSRRPCRSTRSAEGGWVSPPPEVAELSPRFPAVLSPAKST